MYGAKAVDYGIETVNCGALLTHPTLKRVCKFRRRKKAQFPNRQDEGTDD